LRRSPDDIPPCEEGDAGGRLLLGVTIVVRWATEEEGAWSKREEACIVEGCRDVVWRPDGFGDFWILIVRVPVERVAGA